MITYQIEGYLKVKDAEAMKAKYPSMLIQSNEDFNGQTIYRYVERVQFQDEDEAMLFLIEASDSRPVKTDKPFKAGHTRF
jgi:hypothetical protein